MMTTELRPPMGRRRLDVADGLNRIVARSLPFAGMAVAALYALFVGIYRWLLPPDVAGPLTVLAVVTVVLAVGMARLTKRKSPPPRLAHPLGAGLFGLVLGNLTVHFGLSTDPAVLADASTLIVGAGCFFLSYAWLGGAIAAVLAICAWGATTRMPADGWQSYVFMLAASVAVSFLVHEVRRRSFLEFLRAESELRRRTGFERLLTSISTRFLTVPPEVVGEVVEEAMEQVRRSVDVDKVYVARVTGEPAAITVIHEASGPGLPSGRELVQGLPAAAFPWFWEELQALRVVDVPAVAELPEQAAAVREFLAASDARSFLAVPLASERGLWGYLGFVMIGRRTVWTEEVVNLLRVLGEIFLVSLDRKDARAEINDLNRQLHHASRLAFAGETSGAVYHQIRNSLMPINAYAGGVRRLLEREAETVVGGSQAATQAGPRVGAQTGSPPRPDGLSMAKLRDAAANILEAAERINGLLTTFLEFVSSGKQDREPLDVAALVENSVRLTSLQARERCVRLESHVPAGLPPCEGCRILLLEVLGNLVLNGINVLTGRPGERRVSVRVTHDGGPFIEFSVSDTGPGVAPEVAENLFRKFYTARADGVGLGLYISRSIVESHGGRLGRHAPTGPESDSEDSPEGSPTGADFRFTLPVQARESNAVV
jgi:signal transduction histidine kinase